MSMREKCRGRLDRYEALLFTTEPEIVVRTPEREAWLDRIAERMHACSNRSHGRPREKIRAALNCMSIEIGLSQRLDVPFSMKEEIDPADPSTFKYDVEFEGDLLETKVFNDKWFSFRKSALSTFLKHAKTLDFLVAAQIVIEPHAWLVGFKIVAHAPTFESFRDDGNHKSAVGYYNHKMAGPDFCRFTDHEYFAKEELNDSRAIYKGWDFKGS
jgi:hypothetical protein